MNSKNALREYLTNLKDEDDDKPVNIENLEMDYAHVLNSAEYLVNALEAGVANPITLLQHVNFIKEIANG